MCPRDDDELDDEFEACVRRQRALIEKGRREKGMSFWHYVGLIGTVGWSVVVPTVAGLLLGRLIDQKTEATYEWTLGLLVLGLAVGCYSAWRIVTKEQ
ncbi:MAG: AtpZ/AtpI family protein [Alphaproteobacteria bacterium]